MLGGGLRQSGIIAAAGLHAFNHNYDGLAEDHRRAEELRSALTAIPGFEVDLSPLQTNIVWAKSKHVQDFGHHLGQNGIVVSASACALRLVLHRNVTDEGLRHVVEVAQRFRTG